MSINTPALLFPAITLLMLAYTNRFLALSTLIRNLHGKYKQGFEDPELLRGQIKNLKRRMTLIKQMQATGVISFFYLCALHVLFLHPVRYGGVCCFRYQPRLVIDLPRALIE